MFRKIIYYYLEGLRLKKENKLSLAIDFFNNAAEANFAPAYIELSRIETHLFNFYTKKAAETGNTISQAYYGEYLLSNELYFYIYKGKLEKGNYEDYEYKAKLVRISNNNFHSNTKYILAIDNYTYFDGTIVNYKLGYSENIKEAQVVYYDGTHIYFYKDNIRYYIDFTLSKENIDNAYLKLSTIKDKNTITIIDGGRIRFRKSFEFLYDIATPFLKQAFSQGYDTMLTLDDQLPPWACENYSDLYYKRLIEHKKLIIVKRKCSRKSKHLLNKANSFLNNSNYLKAISYYKKSAKLANTEAMLNLAYYYMGLLTNHSELDYRLAYEYIKMASGYENNDAKFALAICYLFGIGTIPNKPRGREIMLSLKETDYPYSNELLNILILK